MIQKFKRKSTPVEAMQWPEIFDVDGRIEFERWIKKHKQLHLCKYHGERLIVDTYIGITSASPGDWVVRTENGYLFVFRDDDFNEMYEAE